MKNVEDQAAVRLLMVTDGQWLELMNMVTEGVMAVSGRRIAQTEILFSEGGHYPSMYFRLTSVPEDTEAIDPQPQVSGFVFGFDADIDDEVYIQPLSPDTYREDWLEENGINHFFAWHEVGVKKLYRFLSEELKLWSGDAPGVPEVTTPGQWKTLQRL